jgi:hypothetical protein
MSKLQFLVAVAMIIIYLWCQVVAACSWERR